MFTDLLAIPSPAPAETCSRKGVNMARDEVQQKRVRPERTFSISYPGHESGWPREPGTFSLKNTDRIHGLLMIALVDMVKVWNMRDWVENWKRIGPELQARRDNDIRNSDTARNIAQLEWSYRYVRDNYPVPSSSGLVDFYKILLKDSR